MCNQSVFIKQSIEKVHIIAQNYSRHDLLVESTSFETEVNVTLLPISGLSMFTVQMRTFVPQCNLTRTVAKVGALTIEQKGCNPVYKWLTT